MAVKMTKPLVWLWCYEHSYVDTNVSEKHSVFNFRAGSIYVTLIYFVLLNAAICNVVMPDCPSLLQSNCVTRLVRHHLSQSPPITNIYTVGLSSALYQFRYVLEVLYQIVERNSVRRWRRRKTCRRQVSYSIFCVILQVDRSPLELTGFMCPYCFITKIPTRFLL
jgi:hypothetical protein